MKTTLKALATLAATALALWHFGPSPVQWTEYLAASPDGPYSELPAGAGWTSAETEMISAEEALAIARRLDAIAEGDAPLDPQPASGSAVVLAGL